MKQTKKNPTFLCLHIVTRSGQHLLFFLSKTPGFESLQFGVINWVVEGFFCVCAEFSGYNKLKTKETE